jgi:hypothetical protein
MDGAADTAVDAVLPLGLLYHRRRRADRLRAAGFQVADLVGVEGLAFALDGLDERMADPLARAVVLETAAALERVPELRGIGPHLLATGIRPAA